MANISTIFESTINKAIQSAENVTDFKERALVYAEISKALAMTNMVFGSVSEESATKEALKPSDPVITESEAKTAEKPKAKATTKAKATAKKEPVKEVIEEEDSPWTEEAMEEHAEALEFIQDLIEEYDSEQIVICLKEWSQDTIDDISDITPDNIDAFVIYLQELLEESEDEEEAS